MPEKHIPTIRILDLLAAQNGRTLDVEEARMPPKLVVGYGEKAAEIYSFSKKHENNVVLVRGVLDTMRHDLSETGQIPFMIMPTPNKPFEELRFAQLADVWVQVSQALETCDELYASGFSFSDPHFNMVLLDAAMNRSRPLHVTVANMLDSKQRKGFVKRLARDIPKTYVEFHPSDDGLAELTKSLGYTG